MGAQREGSIFQVIGAITILAGMIISGAGTAIHGLTLITREALATGMIGGCILLAGLAAFLTGRTLLALAVGLSRREAWLWRIFGWITLGAGGITIVFAGSLGWAPTLDQIAVGISGAFAIIGGILALLSARVMYHVSGRKESVQEAAPAAEGASAG